MYHFTLLDIELALESLQWRNIELMQALRLNTAMTIAPYSKQQIAPDELYPLPTDEQATEVMTSAIERAKNKVRRFNKLS